MEQLTLTTPALLFSAISLIMLAYTNRFLAYAATIRTLHDKYIENKDSILIAQIDNIKKQHAPVVIILGDQAQLFLGFSSLNQQAQGLEFGNLQNKEGMINLTRLQNTQFILGASLLELSKQGNQLLKAELWKKVLNYIA